MRCTGHRRRRRHDAEMGAARAVRAQLLLDRARLRQRRRRLRRCCCAGVAGRRCRRTLLETDRRRHADLQRGAEPRLRRAAGDLRRRARRPGSARISTGSSSPTRPIPTSGSPRSAPSSRMRRRLGPQARVYLSPPREEHRAARPATSPISSRAGAAPTSIWSCSTPTA